MPLTFRLVTINDYDQMLALWNSTEQSKRALNILWMTAAKELTVI